MGSSTISSAAQYMQSKGGVVVVAAGNDSLFDSLTDNPYIVTISATDKSDLLASFSNTGNNIDLCAPGVSIMSTTRGGGYGSWTGTSLSAPITAGAAALLISAKPTLTGAEVVKILKDTADDLGTIGWDTKFGKGRLNVYRAIQSVAPAPTPGDTTAPQVVITAPVNGQTVSSPVTVTVNATDNVGVKRVDLYVDGVLVNSSSTAPFMTVWNSSSAVPGNYGLQVKAYDAAGNVGVSAAITVSVGSVSWAPTTARHIGDDLATQGTWRGQYGAEGYLVLMDHTAVPSYASVVPSGKKDKVWSSSTTDARALQKALTTGRIASCWYAPFIQR